MENKRANPEEIVTKLYSSIVMFECAKLNYHFPAAPCVAIMVSVKADWLSPRAPLQIGYFALGLGHYRSM